MKKIAITTTTFGRHHKRPLELLKENGFEVLLNPHARKMSKEELVELSKDAVGIIAGTETLDAEVMEKLKSLKVISRCGSGLDNIDQEAALKKGIKIFNTPDAPALAVAELTVGLILNLLRKITRMHMAIIDNKWDKLTGNLLSGKNVGIIGFGRVGQKVAMLLRAFGCNIAYADLHVEGPKPQADRLTLEELLAWADIVSLHVSGKDRVIGEKELSLMKAGALLVNTSRGNVIDEDALYRALKNGRLCGVALDVFAQEPYHGPLRELDNALLTPHIGAYAQETRVEIEKIAVENLLRGMEE